jgi:hypothetical protein
MEFLGRGPESYSFAIFVPPVFSKAAGRFHSRVRTEPGA